MTVPRWRLLGVASGLVARSQDVTPSRDVAPSRGSWLCAGSGLALLREGPIIHRDVTWVWLFGRERPGDWADRVSHSPAAGISSGAPALPAPRRLPHRTTSMWQPRCCKDAPVNNLMVRSQSACSFQGPGISGSR